MESYKASFLHLTLMLRITQQGSEVSAQHYPPLHGEKERLKELSEYCVSLTDEG